MPNCKYCDKYFENSLQISGHTTWCDLNPNKENNLKIIGPSLERFKDLSKKTYRCKFCEEDIVTTLKQYALHTRWCLKNPERKPSKKKLKSLTSTRVGSPEFRKLISEKRKAYLAANKENHPWSRYSNKESKPESNFRIFAEKINIPLVQYYIPPESNRFFEIDFANLESKIGFEINGNQHYLEDRKTLTPYYQERHDHLTSLRWKILELHYSLCFNEDNIEDILRSSFQDFKKCEEKVQDICNDRIERKKEKEKEALAKKNLIEERRLERLKLKLEKEKLKADGVVSPAKKRKPRNRAKVRLETGFSKKPLTQKEIEHFIGRRKVVRPSKEELHQMLWSMPSTKIAEHFGVSDKCIQKWADGYGISKPPRGHWAKLKAGKI
jgi:hypothetical protein